MNCSRSSDEESQHVDTPSFLVEGRVLLKTTKGLMTKLTNQDLEILKTTDVMTTTVDEEKAQLERKIQDLELERINLRVTPHFYDQFRSLSEHSNKSIEDFCLEVLQEKLDEQVGTPSIKGPSALSGHATTKKITGPSWTSLPN